MDAERQRPTWSVHRSLFLSATAVILLLAFLGVWSVRTQIAGAVVGAGVIEVATTRTAVQHPIGGVVVEILKRDGDRVRAGEVVLRLDDSKLRSDLAVNESALFETLASIARLEAAIEERHELDLDPLLVEAAARDPNVRALVARQQRQLDTYFTAIATEMSLIDEQTAQTGAQIDGVEAQLAAKQDEQSLLADELARSRELAGRELIRTSELTALETEDVKIRGEIGQFESQIADLRGRIAENRLKRLTVVTDAAELAETELNRLRPERTRLLEERSVILDERSHLEIRAPVSGRIIDSQVFGLHSVVVAASPLMMIVPDDEPVLARVRVFATDVDQVHLGQDASLKFKAFDGRQLPIILGTVRQVSADAFLDQRTQKTYYDVLVALDDAELAKLGQRTLIPGMPVEAFMATDSRTPLNYALRPIMVYFDRAFRDS